MPPSAAVAAGGHFDVDDAGVLAPGRCQVETWWARSRDSGETLLHAGPACRVGAVELGLNVDRFGPHAGALVGPQIKWTASTPDGQLGAGIVVAIARDSLERHVQATAYAPVTWTLGSRAAINVNAGADRALDGSFSPRFGASAELQAGASVVVIAERIHVAHRVTHRLGVRRIVGATASIDVSVARRDARTGPTATLGFNVEFARP